MAGIEQCDICNQPATYEAWGGPVMELAETVGASMDRPFPQNKVFRCDKHRDSPNAKFGRLWRWRKINQLNRSGGGAAPKTRLAVNDCTGKATAACRTGVVASMLGRRTFICKEKREF